MGLLEMSYIVMTIPETPRLYATSQSSKQRLLPQLLGHPTMSSQVQPPSGPKDAELVLWEEAQEWAEMEIQEAATIYRPAYGLHARGD